MCHDNASITSNDQVEQVLGTYIWLYTYHDGELTGLLMPRNDVDHDFEYDPMYGSDTTFRAQALAFAVQDCHRQAWYQGLADLKEPPKALKRLKIVKTNHRIDVHSVWKDNLRFSSDIQGDCFFDSIAEAIWGSPNGRALRRVLGRLWRQDVNAELLATVSCEEQTTPRSYVQQICSRKWGGLPEAIALTREWPLRIHCWTPTGEAIVCGQCFGRGLRGCLSSD